jgi:hypothetical protein
MKSQTVNSDGHGSEHPCEYGCDGYRRGLLSSDPLPNLCPQVRVGGFDGRDGSLLGKQ